MTTKQGQILIIDDEELVRRVIHRKLSSEGYHCLEAANAEQAMDKLKRNSIELLILDIKMPGKSGIELLPEIREHYPDAAVIMATVIADTHTAIQCMRQGVFDFVTKPLNLEELVLTVDKALEMRRLKLIKSDEQYKLIFESANDILLFLDRHGKILDVNEKLKELGGYEREDLIGNNIRSLTKLMSKRSLAVVVKNFMKRVAGFNVPPYEVEMVAKSGELLTVEINAVAIKREGKIVGDLAILKDVTERKRAEEALRESEEKWRSLVTNLPDIVMLVDRDSIIQFINYTVPGIEVQDVIGKSIYDYIQPEHHHTVRKAIGGVFKTGKPGGYEILQGVGPDGRTSWYETRIGPIKRGGRVIVVTQITSDVTERKRAEEEIKQLYEQVKTFNIELEEKIKERTKELEVAVKDAKAANQAKSEFLSGMSHELRTPLTAIIGFSQVLVEQYFGKLNEKQAEYTKDILDSGEHLLSLINDVLDLAKVEAGKAELEPSNVNMKELLENSLVMIKEKALKHSLSLEAQISSSLDNLLILADQRKLKQVVFNLLSNAAKFTPDNGRITVEAIREAGEIIVSVADTGIGIELNDQKKIFDQFYQAYSGPRDKTAGTGLGLPLSKHFVEMHGGRIWVESEGKDKGSRFIFSLPIREVTQKTELGT